MQDPGSHLSTGSSRGNLDSTAAADGNAAEASGVPVARGEAAEGGFGRVGPGREATIFFYLIFVVILGATAYLFSAFVHDVVLAFVITALISPVYERLMLWSGQRKSVAALTSVALVAVTVAAPIATLAINLFSEAQALYLDVYERVNLASIERFFFGRGVFAQNVRRLARKLGVAYTPEAIQDYLSDVMSSWSAVLYDQINVFVSNTVAILFHFGIILLMVFYMLQEADQLKPYIRRLTPLPDDEDERLEAQFKAMSKAIVYGNGIGSLIQGVLGGLALSVVDIRSPVLWGTVMALFSSLPVIGVSIVSVPAALYLAFQGDYLQGFLLYAFCSIMNLVVENVVKTKLIGSQIQIHSLLIFMSILGGLGMFGILGLLYGPLLVALALAVMDLYDARYRVGAPERGRTGAP